MRAAATPQGYRVGANPSPELRRFGLRPRDVIESVNGQAVGGGSGDERVLERARTEGNARVVIPRDGRRSTLSFPLR